MNSWDKYYQEFKSELLRDRRLILSLKDNEESKKLLDKLGYKFDPEVDHIDNCKIGGYYFWTANVYLNYDDDDDTACEKLIKSLYKMNKDFDVPSMKKFGIDEKNFEDMLENMATDAEISGAPNLNPRVPSINEMIDLYGKAWRAF